MTDVALYEIKRPTSPAYGLSADAHLTPEAEALTNNGHGETRRRG
jgi:hypothetical protein